MESDSNSRVDASGYRWTILGVLWASYIVAFTVRLVVGSLAPFIKDELYLTNTQVGLLMSVANFGYMLSLIPAGVIVDRIGSRILLIAGEILAGLIITGMFLAHSFSAALAVMALTGFAAGCVMPSGTKGVMDWFLTRERATAMGVKQTGANVGGIIAASVLPAVALAMGWRWGFLTAGLLSIIIGVVSWSLYKNAPVSGLLNQQSNTISQSNSPDMSYPVTEVLKKPDVWLLAFAGFCMGAVQFAVNTHLVLYLNRELMLPIITSGGILAITQAGGILGKPGSGFLSDRLWGHSRAKVFTLLSGISCLICLLVAFGGSSLSLMLYPVMFILGMTAFGWGGINLTLAAEFAGPKFVGVVTSMIVVINLAGFTFGPVFFGYIVDVSSSYSIAWLALAICSGLAIIALLFVREDKRLI